MGQTDVVPLSYLRPATPHNESNLSLAPLSCEQFILRLSSLVITLKWGPSHPCLSIRCQGFRWICWREFFSVPMELCGVSAEESWQLCAKTILDHRLLGRVNASRRFVCFRPHQRAGAFRWLHFPDIQTLKHITTTRTPVFILKVYS